LTVSTISSSGEFGFTTTQYGLIFIEGSDDRLYIATNGTGNNFVRFAQSDNVGPSANWATGTGSLLSSSHYGSNYFLAPAADGHLQSGDNYIGFRLDKKDGSGDLFYGWANLNLDLTNGTASITEWAYDDTADAAILVDPIPEPSSLALLAMGAGGLFAYRARRKKRSAEVTV